MRVIHGAHSSSLVNEEYYDLMPTWQEWTQWVRHVKCDEEDPACYQCRKTGRSCDGYSSAKSNAGKQVPVAVADFQIPNLTIARIGQELSGSNQERRCFKYFECEIGRDMKYAFNTSHTHQLILQAGYFNDAIKHAVVALGSLGERLIEKQVPFEQAPRRDDRLDFGRLQYTRAIRQLQECISSPKHQSLEIILACCFLLAIFDFLCGDESMALVHLEAGLSILDRCYSKSVQAQFSHPNTDFDDKSTSLVHELFRIFSIMDLHAAIWLGNSSFHSRPLISPQAFTTPPPQINTLDPTLGEISTQLNYHVVCANVLRHSTVIKESNLNGFIAPFQELEEKHRLLHGLREWSSMLERFLSSRAKPVMETTILRISLMKMTFHSTLISLSTFLQTPSVPLLAEKCDIKSAALYPPSSPPQIPLTISFAEILSLAHEILHPVSPANRTALLQAVAANAGEPLPAWNASVSKIISTIPLFAFVSGAIQPLYLAATRCPDLRMCETAISLLEEVPWREGAWDGLVMARIARRRLRERTKV